jgi:excisionase family DNA binding protein
MGGMMSQELYSVEQVADRLGLHVRTVRNYVRDGLLKAVRIGKQYRIAREDLERLTGGTLPATPRESARRQRHVEASSIVTIDAIGAADASRIGTALLASVGGPREDGGSLRVQTVYDEERARLKIVVLGDVEVTGDALRLIATLAEAVRG